MKAICNLQLADVTKLPAFLKIVFLLTLIIGSCSGSLLQAQSFIEPLENCGTLWFPKHHECIITDVNGNLIEGEIINGAGMGSAPKWLKIRKSSGEEIKITAEEIRTMKVKASDLIKFSTALDHSVSITKSADANWQEIINKEYLFYEQALAPKKKKNKTRLYLLLNPGFDSKIKVYDDPIGSESGSLGIGGIQVTGGKEKSYLVVKGEAKSFKVKKGDYKKLFADLYGDCRLMLEMFGDKKPKFKDFAAHVFAYDQACR